MNLKTNMIYRPGMKRHQAWAGAGRLDKQVIIPYKEAY